MASSYRSLKQSFRSLIYLLFRVATEHPVSFCAFLLTRGLGAGVATVNLWFTSLTVNTIAVSLMVHHLHGIAHVLILFALFKLLTVVLSTIDGPATALFTQQVVNWVQTRVMLGVSRVPLEELEQSGTQDELFFLRNQSATKSPDIVIHLVQLGTEVLSLLAMFSLITSWGGAAEWLVFIAVLPVVMVDVGIKRWGYQLSVRLARLQRENYYYSYLLTGVQAIRELATFQAVEHIVRRYHSNFLKIYRQTKRFRIQTSSLRGGAFFASTLLILFTQFWLIQFGVVHRLSIGQIMALFQSVASILTSLETIIGTMNSVYNDALFTNRMTKIPQVWHTIIARGEKPPHSNSTASDVQAPVVPEVAVTLPRTNETPATTDYEASSAKVLELQDVGYHRSGTLLFSGINLRISPGDRIGLIGTNGRGKTTLCEVMGGIRQPTLGRVSVDGVPLEELTDHERSHLFSFQFQDFIQFQMKYGENITFGEPITGANINELSHFIHHIDPHNPLLQNDGMLTQTVGTWFEGSRQLSGGQWQRLALYRTFWRKVPFYILDEPTANLDRQATEDVVEMIERIIGHSALVVISHDPDFLQRLSCRIYELLPEGLVEVECSNSLTVPLG